VYYSAGAPVSIPAGTRWSVSYINRASFGEVWKTRVCNWCSYEKAPCG